MAWDVRCAPLYPKLTGSKQRRNVGLAPSGWGGPARDVGAVRVEACMSGDTRYDGELQMYVDERRDASQSHLLFLKWLVDHDLIERPIADGPADPAPEPLPRTERPIPNRLCVPRWFGR
jgi:hypothetical protein